ncbi:MAG: hypothetical protein H0W34_14770 [Pyrinomonadaceae bacterium]|nr:hypothetical protein [Pyrinomonadaceae bacterium]
MVMAFIAACALPTPCIEGQQVPGENVIAKFIAEPPLDGRGPSRSIFQPPAATLLARSILDERDCELRQQLSADRIDELTRLVFQISRYRTRSESAESGLEAIDQLDEPYEQVLADAFKGRARERLAIELLRLDGLSAIRRPSVAQVLDVDEMTRKKIRGAVLPTWESAISLHRAIFEGAVTTRHERKQISDGLALLSRKADRAALTLLSAEQVDRLKALLVKAEQGQKKN